MGSMKSDESLPSLPSAVSTDSLPDSVATSSELAQCQTVHVDTAGSNGEPSLPPVSDEEMEFSDHCSLSSVSESELGLLEKTDHHVPGPAEMKKWLITLKAENHENFPCFSILRCALQTPCTGHRKFLLVHAVDHDLYTTGVLEVWLEVFEV